MFASLLAALFLAPVAQAPASAPVEPGNVAECRYEDGSGQRHCVWDARHRGNGEGRSFIALDGGTDRAVYIRITHRRAHRLTH